VSRPLDRARGKAVPSAPDPFTTRAFGTTKAEAAKIAAAAAAAAANYPTPNVAGDPNPSLQAGGRPAGATGGAGASTNLTTSNFSSPASRGSALP
jgi:hypothetical protein